MYDMFIVDFGQHKDNVVQLQEQFPHAQTTRYFGSHLDTIRRCVKKARTSHVWVIASFCDYQDFNFEFEPNSWERNQIHCWASGTQQFGDTFLVPVDEFTKQQNVELLEWFRDVNYHSNGVARFEWPVVWYTGNNLTDLIQATQFDSEYILFAPEHTNIEGQYSDPVLWTEKQRQLVSFNTSNSISLVPRQAKMHLKTQVYDYPVLCKQNAMLSPGQDIVFISYDELQADEMYAQLLEKYPGAKRVHGVEGMENALKAAAQASTTPWFFAVFAKTRLYETWNFNFVPDYWQQPKHYIFHAINQSNDLVYGEMGIILYHRDTVISSPAYDELGVDFTMSFATETIPVISCYGEFATDPYRAWRTAFRETSKLCYWQAQEPCIETEYRIHRWTTYAHGDYSEWVLRGANDGRKYYEQCSTVSDLKKTFRWAWLREYFESLYGKTV